MVKIISSNSIGSTWNSDADVKPNDRRNHNIKNGTIKKSSKGGKKK